MKYEEVQEDCKGGRTGCKVRAWLVLALLTVCVSHSDDRNSCDRSIHTSVVFRALRDPQVLVVPVVVVDKYDKSSESLLYVSKYEIGARDFLRYLNSEFDGSRSREYLEAHKIELALDLPATGLTPSEICDYADWIGGRLMNEHEFFEIRSACYPELDEIDWRNGGREEFIDRTKHLLGRVNGNGHVLVAHSPEEASFFESEGLFADDGSLARPIHPPSSRDEVNPRSARSGCCQTQPSTQNGESSGG